MEGPMQQSIVFQFKELYKLNPQHKQNHFLKPTQTNIKKQRKASQASNATSWKQVQKKLKLKDYICLVNASSKVSQEIDKKTDRKAHMKSKYKFDSQKIHKVIIQEIQVQFSHVLNKLNQLKQKVCEKKEEPKSKLKHKLSHAQKAGKIAVLYDMKNNIKQKLMKNLIEIQELYEQIQNENESDITDEKGFKFFQLSQESKHDNIYYKRA